MKSLVVIINGKPMSGKDKFVELCGNYATVKNVSSIDLVKEAFRIMCYIKKSDEISKNDVTRRLMSMMKTMSIELNDAPFHYCRDEVVRFLEKHTGIIFVHIREAAEIAKLKEFVESYKENHSELNFDLMTLKIEYDQSVEADNPSDNDVDNYEYDMTLKNPGTEEAFDAMAKTFVEGTLSSF